MIAQETLEYLMPFLERITIDEGLREALKIAAENRKIRELAKSSGVHENTLRRYQHGMDNIYLDNAIEILRAMGLQLTVKPR